MDKWEYFVTGKRRDTDDILTERINKLGEEGWELVGITPPLIAHSGLGSENENNFYYIFKRRKP